jgi:hypothetical protein
MILSFKSLALVFYHLSIQGLRQWNFCVSRYKTTFGHFCWLHSAKKLHILEYMRKLQLRRHFFGFKHVFVQLLGIVSRGFERWRCFSGRAWADTQHQVTLRFCVSKIPTRLMWLLFCRSYARRPNQGVSSQVSDTRVGVFIAVHQLCAKEPVIYQSITIWF